MHCSITSSSTIASSPMPLTSRIRRLERDFNTHRCPECGGKGKFGISHAYEEDPAPPVEGCPTCGEVFHIVIRYVNKSLPGQPVVEMTNDISAEELGRLYG